MTDFTYSDADKSLSYTLDKGRHNLSFVLVDEAGNLYTVQEVSFIVEHPRNTKIKHHTLLY